MRFAFFQGVSIGWVQSYKHVFSDIKTCVFLEVLSFLQIIF